jgi:hypothetical protein
MRNEETRLAQRTSLYGYCFNIVLGKLLKTAEAAPLLHESGLAFVLEAGNSNNGDVWRLFHEIRRFYNLEGNLKSLKFEKRQGPAIQLADFLAFYSRRHAVDCDKHNMAVPAKGMLDRIQQSMPHYMSVATDFHA